MKNPPILISIIGFFAALAGFGFLFFGLRVVGFDWFGALGNLPAFDHVGLWGWLAIATGIVWLLAAIGLWTLQRWARLFALIMAGIALFEAVLALFQFPGQGIGLAMAIMPALILWYLNSAEVKAAFTKEEPVTVAPTTAVPATATREPVAAPMAVSAAVATDAAASKPVAAPVAVSAAAPAEKAAPEPATAPVAAHLTKIEDIEGISDVYADQLAAVGIKTTDDLLTNGARRYDREKIAETTGISSELILDWVDKVDLMRVPGVGPQYSDLLEAAGVDSPAELAQRNPTNLAITVQEVVAARPGIVHRVPSEAEIAVWIEEAGKLEKVVEH